MAKSGGSKGKPGPMTNAKPAAVNKPPVGSGKMGGGKPSSKGKGC